MIVLEYRTQNLRFSKRILHDMYVGRTLTPKYPEIDKFLEVFYTP